MHPNPILYDVRHWIITLLSSSPYALSLSKAYLRPLLPALISLQIGIRPVRQCSSHQYNRIQPDAKARCVVRTARGIGYAGGGNFRFGIAGLLHISKLIRVTHYHRYVGRWENKLTWRFNSPTRRPSRISRASSLWPTSSKASVASWPATSRRTSSPPLYVVVSNQGINIPL
jgi:hypothetical protein